MLDVARLRGSQFNLRVELPGGRTGVVNTRSGAAIETPADVDRWLFGDGDWPEGVDPEPLRTAGLAVDVDTDEAQAVCADYERARATDDVLLTISPTVACNLRCPYCFEADHPNRYLRDDEMAAIVTMVRRRLARGGTGVDVTWFGGEPLLHLDGIRRLTRLLRSAATFAGATYAATIVTNGTRLSAGVAAELRSLGVRSAQISLDGDQPRHDATRIDIRGRGSFERIVSAIEESLPHLDVQVRVQVDRESARTVPDLLDRLAARGLQRVALGFVALDPPTVFRPGGDEARFLTVPEFAELEIGWLRHAASLGFDVAGGLEPTTDPMPCAAVHEGHLGVEPGGHLTRCWADVADPAGRIGSVASGAATIDDRDDRWRDHMPFDSGCEHCAVLPLCVGGCPKARISGAMVGADPSERIRFKERFVCSPRKFNLAALAAEGLL